jgi:hypothetical protein
MADDRNQMLALLMGEAMKDLQPAPERSPKQRIATAISDVMLSIGQGLANRGRGGQTTGAGAALSTGPLLAQQRREQAEAKRTQALQMAMQVAQLQDTQSDLAMRRNKEIFAAMSGTQGPMVAGFDFGIQTRPDEPPIPTPKRFEMPHPAVGALGSPPTGTDVLAREEAMKFVGARGSARGALEAEPKGYTFTPPGMKEEVTIPNIPGLLPVYLARIYRDTSGTTEENFTAQRIRIAGGDELSPEDRMEVLQKARQDWQALSRDPEQEDLRRKMQEIQIRQLEADFQGYGTLKPAQFEYALQLVSRVNSDPAYRNMLDINSGLASVMAGLAQESGMGDIAAINGMQIMIDPGATVREGDVALQTSAIAFMERISLEFTRAKLKAGDKLPQAQRDRMLELAQELFVAHANNYNDRSGNTFRRLAEGAGVPFNMVGQTFEVFSDTVTLPDGTVITLNPD